MKPRSPAESNGGGTAEVEVWETWQALSEHLQQDGWGTVEKTDLGIIVRLQGRTGPYLCGLWPSPCLSYTHPPML